MFCPSSVEVGIFINTAMTCSQTGGMTVGTEGVIKVGMVSGGLAVGGGGGGGGERGLWSSWRARGGVRGHYATRGSGHGVVG